MTGIKHTINFAQLGMHDLEQVGGKNSSLGEMISHLSSAGVLVPGGFATTAESFKEFLAQDGLDQRIYAKLASLNTEDTRQLAQAGKEIRDLINATPFTAAFEQEVKAAYQQLTRQ